MPNDTSRDSTEHVCCTKSESVDSDSQLDSIIDQIMALSKYIPDSSIEQKSDEILNAGSNFSALAKSVVGKHLVDLSVSHPNTSTTLPESSQTDYVVDKVSYPVCFTPYTCARTRLNLRSLSQLLMGILLFPSKKTFQGQVLYCPLAGQLALTMISHCR